MNLFLPTLPILVFSTAYLFTCKTLLVWINFLKQKIQMDWTNEHVLYRFDDFYNLLEALQLAIKTFSHHILYTTTGALLIVIVLFFRSFSFLMGNQEFDSSIWCFVVGFLLVTSGFVFFITSLNLTSDMLKDELNGLIKVIHDRIFQEHSKAIVSGNVVPIKEAKQILLNNLSQFQGFHGMGYFNLGKPLLTGMLANFATYLIILIQFKVTELTSASANSTA